MTRRFNRLSALVALAMLCIFAGVPASAQSGDIFGVGSGDIFGVGSRDIGPSVEPKTAKGLATKKGRAAQKVPYIQPSALLGVFVQPATPNP